VREILIIRKKSFYACLIGPAINIDGVIVGKVKNGETVKFTVDDDEHTIFTHWSQGKGNVLHIQPGVENIVLHLNFKNSQFNLTSETDYANSQNPEKQSNVQVVNPVPVLPKKQTASYICGTVISLLLIGLSYYLYTGEETSLIGFILGALFSIATGAVIIIGGFWFIIIPLPYIYIWKVGCLKPNQSMKRKVILGILTFIFLALVFVMLFALSNVNI